MTSTSFRMAAGVFLLLTLTLSSVLAAQVGHPPRLSPYRDIRKGHTFTVTAGYFGGDGGDLGIGPHNGPLIAGRYDIRTAGALQIGLGIAYADLERFIVNPFVTLANRRSGPVSQSVIFTDLNAQFNISGGKSWHRIAPFLGIGGGLAFASSTPADTSGFDFGNEFYLAPSIGFRYFLSDRVHIRAEARATFWKLDYPDTFKQEPVEEPGTVEDPNAVLRGGNLTDWSSSSWLQAGLGYSFTF